MKTFQSNSVRVHVNHQGVYLVIKDSKGRELIFEPPTSSVKQQWVEDMNKEKDKLMGEWNTEAPDDAGYYEVKLKYQAGTHQRWYDGNRWRVAAHNNSQESMVLAWRLNL